MKKRITLDLDTMAPLQIAILREITCLERVRDAFRNRMDHAADEDSIFEEDIRVLQNALAAIKEAPWED